MELAFQKHTADHLQKRIHQVISQEETTEAIVPDSMPDMGRIVGCWGVPVVRSKELRAGSMQASGGVNAWVLCVPEDDPSPRQISVYLPFTLRWELPGSDTDGEMRISCRLKSMDARMLNSRKLLVRANLSGMGEAYFPVQTELSVLESPPQELEVLQQTLPLLLPSELTEKSFLLDEELELPSSTPAISQIIAYQLQPGLSDARVMGEKAVFKGTCSLHLLYQTPEDRLAVWDFEVPYSQFTELGRTYDQEEELQPELLITGLEVTTDEEGRRIRLKCSLAAQCLVLCHQNMTIIQDLYSLRQSVTPKKQALPIRTRLDRQILREQAEATFPIGAGNLVDGTALPDYPKAHRESEAVVLETPVWCSLLYYDENGALQGRAAQSTASSRIALTGQCQCQASSRMAGPVQWSLGGGEATLRIPLETTADSYAERELETIQAADLGEPVKPDPNRPSLILRTLDAPAQLWELAKASGSTLDAIRKANHLEPAAMEAEGLLLIPIL